MVGDPPDFTCPLWFLLCSIGPKVSQSHYLSVSLYNPREGSERGCEEGPREGPRRLLEPEGGEWSAARPISALPMPHETASQRRYRPYSPRRSSPRRSSVYASSTCPRLPTYERFSAAGRTERVESARPSSDGEEGHRHHYGEDVREGGTRQAHLSTGNGLHAAEMQPRCSRAAGFTQ